MLRTLKTRAAVILCLVCSSTSYAQPQVDWIWDRETLGCGLMQAYNARGDIVRIGQTPGSDLFYISIRSAGLPAGQPIAEPTHLSGAVIKFSPAGEANADLDIFTSGAGRVVQAYSVDPELGRKFAEASALEFLHDGVDSQRIPIRSAAAAVEAIRNCGDAKLRKYGIDPAALYALKSRPLPLQPPSSWLSSHDYPRGGAYGFEGIVTARLEVGADGRVKDCKSLTRDKYSGFRDAVCRAMVQRGRFMPAVDSGGNPVPAPFIVNVHFRIAG